VETGRWTAAYAANGDLTRATDVTRGNRFGRVTQRDAHGRMKAGVTDGGVAVGLDYSPRGFVVKETTNAQAVTFTQNALGQTTQVRTPDAQTLSFEYDTTHRLVGVKLNGANITPQMIAKGDYPDTLFGAATAQATALAIEGFLRLLPTAHAQTSPIRLPPVIVPGRESPGQPSLDPEIDRLLSRPFTDYDSNARRIAEQYARMCECKPDEGYSKPTFTSVTYAHLLFGGHLSERFSSKGYFSSTEAVGQTLVDEIVRVGSRVSQPRGSRVVWEATLTRSFLTPAGYARQSDGTFKPTDKIRMVIEANNCATNFRAGNEVVTMFPID
jgi:YD repeat-containing protein